MREQGIDFMDKALLLIAFAVTCFAGCSAAPIANDQQLSPALNIARAAGFDDGLRDVEIPEDAHSDLRSSAAYGAAFAISGYYTPSPGLTRSGTAGLNLAGWLLEPDKPSGKSLVVAWQPTEGRVAEVARAEFVDAFTEAAQEAARAFGMETWVKKHADATGAYLFVTSGNDEYCQGVEYCLLFGFRLDDPRYETSAPEVAAIIGDAFFYSPYDKSVFTFNKQFMGFSELAFLQEISRHLPTWCYFYAPPKKLKMNGEDALEAPVVVSDGEALFFVKQEARP